MYEDFLEKTYEEIIEDIEEIYKDNKWSFFCSGAKLYKYKNQYLKIMLAEEEDELI